jgi:manganese/iron transport system substrate-binding protein
LNPASPFSNHRIARTAIVVVAVFLATAGCGAAGSATSPAGDPIRVVATTTVLGDLVAQTGGGVVAVTSLVPKGGEVHTFDPTPSDLRAVADADLIVMNGLGLDDWLDKVIADSGDDAPVVRVAEDLDGVHYLSGDGEGEAVNPHLWLNVKYAIKYVERIREALVTLDPARADGINASAEAYIARLDALDSWVLEQIDTIPPEDRVIVSFHEAFPYFAEAYGLTIVGTIVDAPGQDPSAGEIAALVTAIRESGAKAVFGEVQFSPELVQTVAEEAGAVVESDLYNDSLGDPPVDSYEGLIRWDVEKVVAALQAP